MRFILCAAFLGLLCSCSNSDDAQPDGPCDTAHPGVRVRVTIGGFKSQIETPWLTEPASLYVMNSQGIREGVSLEKPDGVNEISRVLRYPVDTRPGSATIGYYLAFSSGKWEGATQFTADPNTCQDVALSVAFEGPPDAGP